MNKEQAYELAAKCAAEGVAALNDLEGAFYAIRIEDPDGGDPCFWVSDNDKIDEIGNDLDPSRSPSWQPRTSRIKPGVYVVVESHPDGCQFVHLDEQTCIEL